MKIFNIFRIRKEERWIACVALLFFLTLNVLTICKYYNVFTPLHEHHYWSLFIGKFHISGFDPITYYVVSDWEARYNVYRHPLLSFAMYVPYVINRGLIALTGMNCVQFVVAVLLVMAAFYSFIFIRRIFREIIGLEKFDANLLSAMLFSFSFVMLASMVPDHFILSMFALLLTLYLSGRWIKNGSPMHIWHSIVLFVLTGGISLNNGLKVFLSGLFVNQKRFFRPKFFLLGVFIPALLMWGFSRFEYKEFVWAGEQARHAAKEKRKAEQKKKELALKATQDSVQKLRKDTAARLLALSLKKDVISKERKDAHSCTGSKEKIKGKENAKDDKKVTSSKSKPVKQGNPICEGEFMRWTDISTSRWQSIVENLFGESIQLHQTYLLQDEFRNRPMIVSYNHWWNYAVECVIVLFFIVGIWCGRRFRFFWLAMSYFLMDMVLHIGLGFGINEVYIMAPHWIYVLPLAIGYLLKQISPRYLLLTRLMLVFLVIYLFAYNLTLLSQYMVG